MRTPLVALCLTLSLVVAGCGEDRGRPDREPVGPEPTPAAQTCPAKGGFDTERLVGKDLGAAESLAARNGCSVRPVAVDGKSLPVTKDLRPNRINVVVEDNLVTKVDGLY